MNRMEDVVFENGFFKIFTHRKNKIFVDRYVKNYYLIVIDLRLLISGGSLERPLPRPNFLHFHADFGKAVVGL